MYIHFLIYIYIHFRLREDLEAAAFDNQSSSLIKLNNGTILYLREVNKFLALVCILREDNFDRQGENNYFNMNNTIFYIFYDVSTESHYNLHITI